MGSIGYHLRPCIENIFLPTLLTPQEMLGDDNKPKKKKMQVLRTLNQRQLKQAMDEDASTNYEDEEDIMQVSATNFFFKFEKLLSRVDR